MSLDAEKMAALRDFHSRRKVLFVGEQTLILAFKGLYVIEGLPDDAMIVGVHHAWERRQFGICIASMAFEPVPDGAEAPELIRLPEGCTTTPQGVRFREFL